MRIIQAMMVLVLLSFIFVLGLVSDDEIVSGTGGVLLCTVLWFGYVILYSYLIIWMVIKKSETAAMMGCFLAWAISLGLMSGQSNIIFSLAYTILPIVLTVLIIRMLWFIYLLGRTPPP